MLPLLLISALNKGVVVWHEHKEQTCLINVNKILVIFFFGKLAFCSTWSTYVFA